MKLDCKSIEKATIIRISQSRIDAACAIAFKERIRDILSAEIHNRIILDLSRVTFIDSSGLGAIVAIRKLLNNGRDPELACLSENVARVFALTRMDRVFTIHDTLETALKDAV